MDDSATLTITFHETNTRWTRPYAASAPAILDFNTKRDLHGVHPLAVTKRGGRRTFTVKDPKTGAKLLTFTLTTTWND